MLRSKRIIVREAQKSEPSPKEKTSQVQRSRYKGITKEKKGPGGLKPKRRNIKKEKKPTARD